MRHVWGIVGRQKTYTIYKWSCHECRVSFALNPDELIKKSDNNVDIITYTIPASTRHVQWWATQNRKAAHAVQQLQLKLDQYFETRVTDGMDLLSPNRHKRSWNTTWIIWKNDESRYLLDTYCKDYEVTSSRRHAHPRCNTVNRVTNEVPMTPIQIQLQKDLRFNTNWPKSHEARKVFTVGRQT